MKPPKRRFLIFFKGKLYKFKPNASKDQEEYKEKEAYGNSSNSSCKVLNIKYSQIDLISLQKPTGSVVVGAASAKKGARTAGLNLEQCIVIRFINKVVVLSQGGSSANNEIKKWYELLKYFGVLQNMRCQYDDGALIGKGNFAMVFEATQ